MHHPRAVQLHRSRTDVQFKGNDLVRKSSNKTNKDGTLTFSEASRFPRAAHPDAAPVGQFQAALMSIFLEGGKALADLAMIRLNSPLSHFALMLSQSASSGS